jgi:glycosyltransferase involved in cell wall biosynthesis/peptidoglycan/xylan/chitin deacetylase (PgdA/CDA1 family)
LATEPAVFSPDILAREAQRNLRAHLRPVKPAAPAGVRRRVAYFVSRFPTTTETFVLRELNAVESDSGVDADLYALFPTPRGLVQPAAQRWLGRVQRPRVLRCLLRLAGWAVRRPFRLSSSIALVFGDYWRRPLTLLNALVTLPIAAEHAWTVRALGTDHVHAHFATYPALAAWFCERLTGVPYSFTVHAHDLYMHQLGLARRCADAAFVVTISEYNRALLEELAPAGVPVHVVHCGVELDGYHFRARAPSSGPVRALCVAALREKKGHRQLFEALASGRTGLERITLDVVGNGRLREELEAYATCLGLRARVRFHGSLTEPEVARKLGEADLFVLPSIVERSGDAEGIPVALMEAMAAGVPVVTSRTTGVPELVREGETGLLADPGDVPDLADKLVRVLDDPAAARERALSARRLVEQEFELRSSAERLVELFMGDRGIRNGNDAPATRPRQPLSLPGLGRPPLVLAYHAIGTVAPALDPEGLMVPPHELRDQIELLLERQYAFVTQAEFARRLRAGEPLNGVCALTFDDGSVDNATVLPPLLEELGVPATLFVCPGLLGRPHPWIDPEAGVRLMSREELEAIAPLGQIEIGSHTNRHADLGRATGEQAYRELSTSKAVLEEMIGMPVLSFAYPYGRYSPACPSAAAEAGYTSAATCGLQGGWSPYELRRELIAPGDVPLRFALKARGLYRPLVSSPPARARRWARNALARG